MTRVVFAHSSTIITGSSNTGFLVASFGQDKAAYNSMTLIARSVIVALSPVREPGVMNYCPVEGRLKPQWQA